MSWSPFRDAQTRARWRELLMRQQNGRCGLCGHRIPDESVLDYPEYAGCQATFDHIVPRAHGGDDLLHNLRLVHHGCNQIRGDADGLTKAPTVHRSLKEPPALPHRVRFNAQGEPWCRSLKWKRAYPTLTSAWVAAFCTFAQTGRVHTPYRCGRGSKAWSVVRNRVSKDPWRFDPIIYWVEPLHRSYHGCGMWHLTSRPTHVLTARPQVALPSARKD